jgi:hypothetical protein
MESVSLDDRKPFSPTNDQTHLSKEEKEESKEEFYEQQLNNNSFSPVGIEQGHKQEESKQEQEKQVTVEPEPLEPQTPQEEKEWKEIPTKHFKVLNISALPNNYIRTNMTKSHIDFWEGNALTNEYSDKLAYISQIMRINRNELSKEEHTFLVLLIETIDVYIQFLNYRLIEEMGKSEIQRSKGGGLVSWFLKKRKEYLNIVSKYLKKN